MGSFEAGSIVAKVKADLSDFKNGMNEAKQHTSALKNYVDDATASSKKFAVGMVAAGAAVVGFGALSVKAYSESQDVATQMNAVIKSTGGIAGVTAKSALDLASALQKVTKFSDEEIASGENLLLTFTNIGKNIFPQATETMLDMSQALGQDVKSSAIQLGKALQDPILGVTALRRVGVNFSEKQQEVIKNLVETGKAGQAQAMILKELQTEFGGSARAAGDTFAGKLIILKNQFNDVQEVIGKLIVEAMAPLTKWFVSLIDRMGGAEGIIDKLKGAFERIRPFIPEIGGAILAMLAPAIISATAAVAGFLLSLAPLALIGAAVGLAIKRIVEHFGGWNATMKKMEPLLSNLEQWFENIKKAGVTTFKAIRNNADDAWNAVKFLVTGNFKGGIFGLKEDSPVIAVMQTIHNVAVDLINVFITLGQFVASLIIPTFNILKSVFEFLWPSIRAVVDSLWNNLLPALQHIWEAVTRLWNALNPALMEALKIIGIIVGGALLAAIWLFINALNVVIQVVGWVIGAFANIIGWIANLISWYGNLYGTIINVVKATIDWFGKLPGAIGGIIGNVVDWFRRLPRMILDALGNLGGLLYDAGRQMIEGMINGIRDTFKRLAGAVKDAVGNAVGAVKNFLGIRSPSKVFMEIGRNVTAGFIQGITDTSHLATAAMTGLTAGVAPAAVQAAASDNSVKTQIYGNINIGSEVDADSFMARLTRNQELAEKGLTTL